LLYAEISAPIWPADAYPAAATSGPGCPGIHVEARDPRDASQKAASVAGAAVPASRQRVYIYGTGSDSEASMAAVKKSKRRTFYASVQVTRIEEWCVEAETAEEARRLLAQGDGERCLIGDCLYLEIENLSE
jgi:hypothetical protein